jgi:hypothetical protein
MVRLTPLQFAYLLRFRRAPSQGAPRASRSHRPACYLREV